MLQYGLNNVLLPTLFNVVNNIVQQVTPGCRLIQAQQRGTILLLTLDNVGSKTLLKPVFIKPEQVVCF